jgi:superfamily II DNA or RNA helicase
MARPPKATSAAALKRGRKATAAAPDPFIYKLALNAWMIGQFGIDPLADHRNGEGKTLPPIRKLSNSILDEDKEGFHEDGRHRFFHELYANWPATAAVTAGELAGYEDNILAHTKALNDRRQARGLRPIVWKYYQWLSLLFAERYLDLFFHEPTQLLDALNGFLVRFNEWRGGKGLPTAIEPFTVADLNRLCFQNATGSGKTLLMHANVLQFCHYAASSGREGEFSRSILVTPNESLTDQHLREMEQNGLASQRFRADLFGSADLGRVDVIEITKLGDVRKENTVAVAEFGDNNLLLVDEGHRGLGSEEETGWLKRREALAARGFVFEYSATFAQAVAAAGSETITQTYAKSILFDYSYRYFYEDGFGKDYSILNLNKDGTDTRRYLTACLLAYFQQLRLYDRDALALRPFHLEKPLWVFVGGSVSKPGGANQDEKAAIADVAKIVLFLGEFLTDPTTSKRDIRLLLTESGAANGMLDADGNDIFGNSFPVLQAMLRDAPTVEGGLDDLYRLILREVFQANAHGVLRITRIKGDSGEIHLRVGQAERPFGLINVGDAKGLADHIGERIPSGKVEIADSEFDDRPLFAAASDSDSPVNILIGAKKFIEGWDCWRVSTLGLMHVGKSEGSQIVQLFGRGVRLKGFGWSLKRSSRCTRVNVPRPTHIQWLETLQVFGIEAEFMQRFRDYLADEGLPGNERKEVVEIPMHVTRDFGKRLKVLRPKRKKDDGKEYDFKQDAPLPILKLPLPSKLLVRRIEVDWYPRIEAMATGQAAVAEAAVKQTQRFRAHQLALIDWSGVFFELEAFKRVRGFENLLIRREDLPKLFEDGNGGWYTLYAHDSLMQPSGWQGVRQWQVIVITLLKRLMEALYNYQVDAFFERRLEYRELTADDANLPQEGERWRVMVDANESALVADLKQLAADIEKLAQGLKGSGKIGALYEEPKASGKPPKALLGGIHLYSPLLHMPDGAGATSRIKVLPVALKNSEFRFVKDLHQHLADSGNTYAGMEFFLLRNKARGGGIGFFEAGGFYPDFIFWILADGRQHIAFIEPHGLIHEGPVSPKVQFFKTIKDIEERLGDPKVTLTSFIVSPTNMGDLQKWGITQLEEFRALNVLLMQDDTEYMKHLIQRACVTSASTI